MTTDPTVEAEQAVLGAALASGGNSLTDTALNPDEFSRPPHRELWQRLHQMSAEGHRIDPLTVNAALTEHPIAGIDGGYLHTLYAAVPTVANAEWHARIVRDAATVRAIHDAGMRMVQAASSGDAERAKANARHTLDALDQHGQTDTTPTVGDLLVGVLDSIETGTTPGMSTPWPDLDERTGGLRPGGVTVVAARPGLGKSIVGLQIATHVARHYGPALLHSLEMPNRELVQRLLSATTQVAFTSLLSKPDDLEWQRLTRNLDDLSNLPLHTDDRATVTVADVAASARRQARVGLRAVVIDYLQLVTPLDRRIPREQQVSEVSRSLKLLAKDLDVAIVVMAQLNRESESRPDRRPRLSDLRESGAVEQDADTVLLLFRDEEQAPDVLEVGVAKARQGRTGRVQLRWDAAHMRVTSLSRWIA